MGFKWQTKNPGDFRAGFAIINGKTSINDFQAEVLALARQRKANILSTPSVVVLDNRQQKFLWVNRFQLPQQRIQIMQVVPRQQVLMSLLIRVNVALHLYVRPQITRGRGIQMQIDQGNDTIDPASVANSTNPTFDISSIVTSVHIESGDIVVILAD